MADYIPPRQIPSKRSPSPSSPPLPSPPPPSFPNPGKPKRSPREREQDRLRQEILQAIQLDRILGETEEAEQSLKTFLRLSWTTVNPGVGFQDSWHLDCLCFPYDTLITTEDGVKPIGGLRNYHGKVLSWNHGSNQAEWKEITAWMRSPGKKLTNVSTVSRSISLTSNHPVFTMERGYVKASEIRIGETIRVVSTVREEVRISPLETCEVLQSSLLWSEQDASKEALCGLREDSFVGSGVSLHEVSRSLSTQSPNERGLVSVPNMRETNLSQSVAYAGISADIRGVLRSGLLREVHDGSRQSSLLAWSGSKSVSTQVQVREEESVGTRREGLFRLLEEGGVFDNGETLLQFRRASHRREREKYGYLESGDPLQEVSQETRESDCGEETVIAVENSLPGPEFVYNIEVRDNHNYFANEILVHNCEHLEALARRQIRRLIINIMPRSYKSGLVSVHFPAWVWLTRPHEKFLCASFGKNLSLRHSRLCRSLIKSKWYQDRWSSRFALSKIQDEKGEFENDKGGYRIAGSVEAGILGTGGNFRIFDDPNDLDRMINEPDSYPQMVRDWYSGTASSRHIDPSTDCMLCIQQRCTYGADLTEYLLEIGGWDQVVIPNEYDGRKFIGPLSFIDPRIEIGDLMFPDRFNREDTELEKRQKKQHYPAQFNQNPSAEGKSGLRREWFNFWVPQGTLVKDVAADGTERIRPVRITLPDARVVERIPVELPLVFEQLVQSWDLAFKGNEDNDFVAGHVWGRIGSNTYLVHREHANRNFPETLSIIRQVSDRFPCPEKLVEDKANGPAVIDTLKNSIPGLIAVSPEGGKWSRVAAISGYVEAGNVYLPSPDLFPWVWEILGEFASGKSAKHDDDTDAMTQALKRLYDAQAQSGLPEFRVQPLTGEPSTACHIERFSIPPDWRRFVAIVPNHAAVWLAESPTESLRVYRELDIERMDASQVGREIAARSLADLMVAPIRPSQNAFAYSYDLYLPKSSFAVIESVGSWAELMEAAILDWDKPDGTWDERQNAKKLVRDARFRCELTEDQLSVSLDRLRELLAFAPADWQPAPYDRKLALALAEKDLGEYHDYMARVDGQVRGEWPKLKISPDCPQIVAQMGTVRRDRLDDMPSFITALLLAVSAPPKMRQRMISARPYVVPGRPNGGMGGVGGVGGKNRTLFSRKFSMR